jgi:hypothetical protein
MSQLAEKLYEKIEEPSSYVLNLKSTTNKMLKKYLGGREMDQSVNKFEE